MRWWSVVLVSAQLLLSTTASAFVTPSYSGARERGRKALIGTWRALSIKAHNGAPKFEPEITITFEKNVLRVESEGDIERATWRVISQEGSIVELEITDSKGKTHDMDVLIESSDALTLYIEDDDGDDEEVLRVERID
jgi:hypothetical protein